MIKLKNIKKDSGHIRCEAYPEDCAAPVCLDLEIESGTLAPYTLPVDYEWCKTHIRMARDYLLANADDLPDERLIMWY